MSTLANIGILSATALPVLVSLPPPLLSLALPSSSPLPCPFSISLHSSASCGLQYLSSLLPQYPPPFATRIMSDRFPQYPQMIPNFNNPSLLQQQQQQQQQHPQQPQHQQLTQQSDQHAAYPDQNRMWQQIQFRPRSGMDINQPAQQQTPQVSLSLYLLRPCPPPSPLPPLVISPSLLSPRLPRGHAPSIPWELVSR